MREQREEVVVANPVEVLDDLDDGLDRVEIWTAALSCFQHPAPEYPPDNFRSPSGCRQPTRSARRKLVWQVIVRRRSPPPPEEGAQCYSSLGGVVRNTLENQPYTAVTIALGLGWLLGRAQRSL